MIEVEVSNRQSAVDVDPNRLADAARLVLRQEGCAAAEISLAVVDDATIHELNRRHLAHDYATDVLSFNLGGGIVAGGKGRLEGEIIVSAQTAAREAPRFGWTADDELLLYVIHGALHLAGYDDHSAADRAQMRRTEARYLQQCGLSPRGEDDTEISGGS